MKKQLLSVCWFVLLSVLSGCGPGNNKSNGNAASAAPVEKGRVLPKITCQKDFTISYALYLPKDYTAGRKFPVIIAFDPQGNGVLPLEKYKALAEKYGYIMMGSNDSKNGQDMNTTGAIIDALFGETAARYSIDRTRIYVLGFSGGARIASIIGLYQGGVAGVIGCGAGFPSTDQPVRFKPDYISFAGNADFNMNELIKLDKQLDEAKFTHASILFNGKHAWPPAEILENAFLWTEFCSMRKGLSIKTDSIVVNFIHQQENIIAKDKEKQDLIAAHDHLLNLIRFVDGLTSTDKLKKEITDLENSDSYKNQIKKLQQLMDKEMNEQQSLTNDFSLKSIDWWKKKVASYELRISKGKDSANVRMCKRLKSYLSLISYMNYNRGLSSNDSVTAQHAMAIYEMVDPENAAATKAGKAK